MLVGVQDSLFYRWLRHKILIISADHLGLYAFQRHRGICPTSVTQLFTLSPALITCCSSTTMLRLL